MECNFDESYVRKLGDFCGKCGENEGRNTILTIVFLIASVIFGAPPAYKMWYTRVWPKQKWPGWKHLQTAIQERSSKARIFFGFVQVASRLEIAFRFQLPQLVRALFDYLLQLELFDLSMVFSTSVNCIRRTDFIDRISLQSFLCLVILSLFGLFYLLFRKRTTRRLILDATLTFIFVIYSSMTTLLFRFLDCKYFCHLFSQVH
jgi:hypothetical protein